MNIELAKQFVLDKVINPGLLSNTIDDKLKNKIKHSSQIINSFTKIGDLYNYLSRFTDDHNATYTELNNAGLETFESIKDSFKNKFYPFINQVTTIDSFVIGNIYSAWDISFCAETYDIKNGIYINEKDSKVSSILIKSTFEKGKYQNQWIKKGSTLKYYFYSRGGIYSKNDGSDFQFNNAIINNDVPVLVFTKNEPNNYRYEGIFKYKEHIIDPDNSKYFIFEKRYDVEELYSQNVADSLSEYFNNATKKVIVYTEQYIRNPQVVDHTLKRANGICEKCFKSAPFIRKSDGSPFLEVHHKKPLSEGGPDTIENTIALCPNCHRELHYA